MTAEQTEHVRHDPNRPWFDPFDGGLPDLQLEPHELLALLCDTGTIRPLDASIEGRPPNGRATAVPGVTAVTGSVGGRPVVCYAYDRRVVGGSLGSAQADVIVHALMHATRTGAPVLAFVDSGGARLQEGGAALAAYARVFRATVAASGRVPQISIVTGVAAGGASYAAALTDFVVMTRRASMFLTGPAIVHTACGEAVDTVELGGARVHERNGVCHFVVPTDVDATFLARELLDYLPQRAGARAPRRPAVPPPGGEPDATVPSAPRAVYDIREPIAAIVDGGRMLELAPRWARNVVTGFCRLDGRSVGVLANQPRTLGGILESEGAAKAARFVRTCEAFGLPLVVFVDTPGFMPGTNHERRGIIRHGAKLLHAFAQATVPRVTVVLRKAFGGAYISMNAAGLGADLVLAWSGAQIGVMDPHSAVRILHRRELDRAEGPDGPLEALAQDYADEHLRAEVAAEERLVDVVIPPSETRARLIEGLAVHGERHAGGQIAGNIPL
ncbi:MAG TPA: carboxyl transferase domain-containing protein [Thermoleophilaceae bacterium]|jgi:acetyl-CoA carboxylase carboxyltransferase component